MKINSEQEMLNFGAEFAKSLIDFRKNTFRDRPRLTRSGLSEAPPVTTVIGAEQSENPFSDSRRRLTDDFQSTGGRERVEKGVFRKPIVIELVGDVGAGKTTFVRGLAKGLGIKEPVTSPSFTISKSYALPGGGRLVHYDFYRLSDPGLMADDLTDSLLTPNNIIILEWSDSVSNFLPESKFTIKIEYDETGGRNLFLQHRNDDLKF